MKEILGISSRSLVHRWDKVGAPGQIPGYATHVEATSRAAKYVQSGGYIGVGIGGVFSLLSLPTPTATSPLNIPYPAPWHEAYRSMFDINKSAPAHSSMIEIQR